MTRNRFAPKPHHNESLSGLGVALQALREGVATQHQWSIAAGGVTVALAIERRGVVPGLRGHIKTAEQALQGIHARALLAGRGRWVRVDLDYQELDALQTFMDLHTYQVDQLEKAVA